MEKTNYTFNELIHNGSFRRWVHGDATPEEKRYWDRWTSQNPANRSQAKRAQKKVAGFSIRPVSKPDQDKAWNRLQKGMNKKSSLYSTQDLHQKNKLPWAFKIAAVFLVITATGLAAYFMSQAPEKQVKQIVHNEVVTQYGEQKTITLNDGSKIILNAHSNLIYTVNSADPSTVEVFLDGEAYFAVAERDPSTDTPFQVRTSEGIVNVMGTKFVVSTRDSSTQVVLEEGRVALKSLIGKNRKEITMKPGQLAELQPGRSAIKLTSVNPKVYSSWTTYMLVFDNTPLATVVSRLENTFGVNVIVRNQRLFERRISGAIDNTSLEIITSALANTLNTPIKVTNGTVYIGK
ncbi:MAG TPA: FecR domain-containing protein [Fodinibius sp.]|nr:FecR domain-containing protein [Fodinibius sp.]